MQRLLIVTSLIICVAGLTGCPRSGPPSLYTTDEVGLDFVDPKGDSLNDMDWVAGGVASEKGVSISTLPSVWISGTLHSLATGSDQYGLAMGLNNAGYVVGGAKSFVGQEQLLETRAWLLDSLPSSVNSQHVGVLYSINEYNFAVGAIPAGGVERGMLTELPGSGVEFRLAGLGGNTMTYDINEYGDMAGVSSDDEGTTAVRWTDGQLFTLETLGGNYSEAFAINNHGIAVGISTEATSVAKGDAEASVRATYWDGVDGFGLPGLGGDNSFAWDINDADKIVGSAEDENGDSHAMLWRPMAFLGLFEAVRLETLIPTSDIAGENYRLLEAIDINEVGTILCRAMIGADEEEREVYVLLRPRLH